MAIEEVTRHAVAEQRIERALEDMWGRAFGRWHRIRYGDTPLLRGLWALGEELADHLGARTVPDPDLRTPDSRTALLTAAECAMSALSLVCFPDGDFSAPLLLVTETLSSEDLCYEEMSEPTRPQSPAQTWADAFAWSVISALIWEQDQVTGPLLREDYAPAVRDGVPYSRLESVSSPTDLAEMDALCGYLTIVQYSYPGVIPGPVPLGKPDAAERARATEQLDTAGTLTPD